MTRKEFDSIIGDFIITFLKGDAIMANDESISAGIEEYWDSSFIYADGEDERGFFITFTIRVKEWLEFDFFYLTPPEKIILNKLCMTNNTNANELEIVFDATELRREVIDND